MAPSSFKFTKGGLERAVREAARDGVQRLAERFQAVLDEVLATHAGRPVDEVKPVLQARWRAVNDGADLTDPELTQYAQALSDGQRVVVRAEDF
ncbi:hypothetical protein ACR9E3_04495 [Actinomycetospora sp. C-140]